MVEGKNETIEKYIEYLSDKGKITAIKDTTKEINIKFSKGIIYNFLRMILIICIVLIVYFFIFESEKIIAIGLTLFTIILFGVVIQEGAALKFEVSYLSDNIIKINNKKYDIQRENCYIDVSRTIKDNYSLDRT